MAGNISHILFNITTSSKFTSSTSFNVTEYTIKIIKHYERTNFT